MRDLSSVWSLIELAAPLFPSQRASPMTSLIPPPIFSEYDFDSSDEEDVRNTVGNIPLQWYDKLAHLGYDVTGRPLMKPGAFTDPKDSIDKFIDLTGDPDSLWRTISDPLTGQTVVLTDTDIEIATKLASGKGITGDTETPFEEWNEWFSSDTMLTPISARPPVKRNFLPSVLDKRKVGRMVHAIKMGWMTPRLPSWAISDPNDLGALRRYAACTASGGTAVIDSDDDDSSFFLGFPSSLLSTHIFSDVWESQHSKDHNLPIASTAESEWRRRLPLALQNYRPPRPSPYQRAAEEPLPGHGASYNPAPEFLLSKDEERRVMRTWRERVRGGGLSSYPPQFPRQFQTLLHLSWSTMHLRDREERVKDLVMAARYEKQRVETTPEAMLPPMPNLSDLRPYPSTLGLTYNGHIGRVTCLSISPCGQWLASISPVDGCLRIWETETNYCFRCYRLLPGNLRALRQANEWRSVVLGKQKRKCEKVQKINENSQDDLQEVPQQGAESDDESGWTYHRPNALVAWNPNPDIHLVAAAMERKIFLINPKLGDKLTVERTDNLLDDWWKTNDDFLTSPKSNSDAKKLSEVIHDSDTPDLAKESCADRLGPKRARLHPGVNKGRKQHFDLSGSGKDSFLEIAVRTGAYATWSLLGNSSSFGLFDELGPVDFVFTLGGNKTVAGLTKQRSAEAKQSEGRRRIVIDVTEPIICLSWHPKGGYLLSLSQAVETNQLTSRTACRRLLLHRLAGMTSQSPFAEALAPDSGPGVDEQLGSSFTSRLRRAEHWRLAAFHPGGTKPHLYVTSDHLVHIFDLAERKELRRLRLDSASDKISAFAVHSSGDHLPIGSSDGLFNWFDIELGPVPFKKFRVNHGTIHQIDVHRRRPLVASACDDGTVLIVHSTVSDDLLSKPVVLPVKLIHTHQGAKTKDMKIDSAMAVFSTIFHTRQPHVYTGSADGTVRQFVDWD